MFPLHVVTARPDDCKEDVMGMLQRRGFNIPIDRLHMLPSHLYDKGYDHVVKFKWDTFFKIARMHSGVVARFGDKLWDVAHMESLETYLGFVKDHHACIYRDPRLSGTISSKLPGVG